MTRDKRPASATLVACATFAACAALSGCGADDSAPAATSTTPATPSPISPSSASSSPRVAADASTPQSTSTLFAPFASQPSFTTDAAASDPVAQTMQANLAADSQQIAPVMHYAPGDSASSN